MPRRAARRTFVALALAVAAVAAALGPLTTASAATRSVGVRDDYFSPATIAIARGDTIRWTWQGRRRHNVANAAFGDSGYKRRGSFSVRFRRAGSYRYFCFLHEGMAATVVVRR
jgi:plastocyanin